MQGDAHFDYDVFGNLVRERRGAGQKLVTEYRYDCQHRLSEVLLPNGQVAKYRYDAFGRRIEKDVAGALTEFFWQGERLIGEWSPGRSRSYVYEPGSFRPLVMVDGDGPENARPYYYQLDHLGTPQELTSAQGGICWSARYKAYCNVAKLDIEEIDNPLRFQGQYFDAETGLHYNRHRYYNPSTGRYLTADPIKLAGGLNSYRYVPNPTGWVDPLGLSDTCPKADSCTPAVPSGSEKPPSVSENEPRLPSAGETNDPKYLYRGDNRHPDTIFEEGFKPRGGSDDLELHAYDNKEPPSNFISTSLLESVASEFATDKGRQSGWLYIIRYQKNGRDVNKELGSNSAFKEEKEIAVPGGIDRSEILGATHIQKKEHLPTKPNSTQTGIKNERGNRNNRSK